jgi:hypothetical protein
VGFTATRDEANPSMGLIPVKPPKGALHITKSIVHFFIKKSLLLPGGYLAKFHLKNDTKSVSNNEILASKYEL